MFKDRTWAGREIARKLKEELTKEEVAQAVVLAIPRGGIIVGDEICRSLSVPMASLVIKKIPSPESGELTIGAIGTGGIVVWEEEICERLKVPLEYKKEIVKRKLNELEKKEDFFRSGFSLLNLENKIAVLVDDGVATGSTVRVSVEVLQNYRPKEIILAVPVIARDSLADLKGRFARVIYLEAPEMFFSVDQFYHDFSPVEDEEVKKILAGR